MKKNLFLKIFKKISVKFDKYKQISYSQCGEDLIIKFILIDELKLSSITYLDIGAHHAKYLSNTYKFYKEFSCTGVLIEPDCDLCSTIQRARKNDVVLNVGIGFGSVEEAADFYVITSKTLNTFSHEQALSAVNSPEKFGKQRIEEVRKVTLVPINNILEKYFGEISLTILSIDVEGLDFLILQQINFSRFMPVCIIVETREILNDKIIDNADIFDTYLKQNGYVLYAKTGINTIFIDKKYIK